MKIKVILLAGGRSQRFWPLYDKLLLPFLGKTLIDHQIEFLQKIGFEKIIAVINKNTNQISDKKIQIVEQKGQGQAAAILSVKEFIHDEPILILNADDIFTQSLFESLFYILNHNVNILVGFKVKNYFPGGYLKLADKKVLEIIEKPEKGKEPSDRIRLVCDYYRNGNILFEVLESIDDNQNDDVYEQAINFLITKGEYFEVLEYEDIWIPMKYPWHTLNTTKYFLGKIKNNLISKSVKIHKSAHISGKVIFGENVRIMENVKIVGPVYIGDNSIIGNNSMIRDSIVGNKCVIGFSSDVARSYIGNDVWLHSNYIGDSVIDNNVSMGAGAVLANLRLDEENIFSKVKREKIDTCKNKFGAIIGTNVRIGVGAKIMPGIKVGKNSYIGPGVILNDDLEENKKCYVDQKIIIEDYKKQLINFRESFREKI